MGGLTREVENYCRSCAVCAVNRSSNGLLKPLAIPERVWDSVGVDFVGPLPTSKEGHDSILVLIDRFSKMVMFRPCKTTITAGETGRLLLDMMLRIGKLPSSIVSDRDERFTSAAWGQLWRGLKTELKMSTAYHPQTDGQTERMNRTMQTLLRAYAEKRADWEEWLPFVAAAYNSSQQESTKRTPFELNFADGRSIDPLQWALRESGKDERGVSVEAERTLGEMTAIWDEVRAKLLSEQAKQKQRQTVGDETCGLRYQMGDSVYLSTRNLPTYRGKLQDKWVGPYVVTEVKSSGVSVRLDLRGELGKTNPVFHVSLLGPYDVSKLEWPGRLQPNRPASELVEGHTEWQVEVLEQPTVHTIRHCPRAAYHSPTCITTPPHDTGLRPQRSAPRLRRPKNLVSCAQQPFHPRCDELRGISGRRRERRSEEGELLRPHSNYLAHQAASA